MLPIFLACIVLAYLVVGVILVAQRFAVYREEIAYDTAAKLGFLTPQGEPCPHCLISAHPFTMTFVSVWCVLPLALLWPWTIVRREARE
jgi:hypothetical protein